MLHPCSNPVKLSATVRLEALLRAIPAATIERVIDYSQVRERRCRKLPAHLSLLLAMQYPPHSRSAGISLLFEADVTGGDQESVTVQHRDGIDRLQVEVVVVADPRWPSYESLNLGAAALATQAEVTVNDLAATSFWHPSIAESLAEAARRAL